MARFYNISGNSRHFSLEIQQRLFEEGASINNGQLVMDPIYDERPEEIWPLFIQEERRICNHRGELIRPVSRGLGYYARNGDHNYHREYDNDIRQLADTLTSTRRHAWIIFEAWFRTDGGVCEPDFRALEKEYEERKPLRAAIRDTGISSVSPGEMLRLDIQGYQEAKRFLEAWDEVAIPTRVFNSCYQPSPSAILDLLRARPDLPAWMIGRIVVQGLTPERLGSIKTLFPACKAWRLSTLFWKDVAVRVGSMPLWKRIIGAKVIYDLARETGLQKFKYGRYDKYCWDNIPSIIYADQYPGCTNSAYEEIWQRDRSVRIEFWRRFSDATKNGPIGSLATHGYACKANTKRVFSIFHAKTFTGDAQAQAKEILLRTVGDNFSVLLSLKAGQWIPAVEFLHKHECDNHSAVIEWENLSPWMSDAALALVAVFGRQWQRWLEKQATLDRGHHDASYWLPKKSPVLLEGLDAFLFKNGQRPIEELEVISKNWPSLSAEERKLSYKNLLSLCRSRKYEGQEAEEFAAEAAKWGISEGTSKKPLIDCEQLYSENILGYLIYFCE